MAYVKRQLRRVGANKSVKKNASPLFTFIQDQARTSKLTKRYQGIIAD
jgi:hypothetical protein